MADMNLHNNQISEIRNGFETAYIDEAVASGSEYKPAFVSNNYKEGKKVLSSVEDELLACDKFRISVAFITEGGIEPLKMTLRELEEKEIPGEILTTNYLNFSEPKALKELSELKNITLKMYDSDKASIGFHTKGYIFQKDEIYRIIIGSSNITSAALTRNREWNTKLISTKHGEMTKEIVYEFNELWNSKYSESFDDFFDRYEEKYNIIKHQRQMAKLDDVISFQKSTLTPNKMQTAFISNLRKIVDSGAKKALLISATGTGKTYASAFAMRELGFKRVLFLVHREQLAIQTMKSYEKVFGDYVNMGVIAGQNSISDNMDKDFIFATVQTISKDKHMKEFAPDAFDCIILDEAHHSSADSYQDVMSYFYPNLFLGMTATPDKRDDNISGRNIYEIFDYQIAYEIRLQQAMEEDLLCPFHYFGIKDISLLDDKTINAKKISERDFNQLTCEKRVNHVIEQANYYSYSGERVKGLIFCSRIDESKVLSDIFNQKINKNTGKLYRTIALNGDANTDERQEAFERLAMKEEDSTDDRKPLDYIFSVDILNEGVDIVEVNQVIMLRPTQSPIVFIQQLGRGLRKAYGKEYVVILDFIGNYNNNFMIPIALSGDRTYNPDTIRKYVISGNNTIPGASTIHFDEISKDKIFSSIDKIKGMKSIIRESYFSLKDRLGRIPYLLDFYDNGEIDPLVIIREYKTYQNFIESVEKDISFDKITDSEMVTLEYLSKTVLSGARPYELLILKDFLTNDSIRLDQIEKQFSDEYGYEVNLSSLQNAIDVLQGKFVSKEDEYKRYCHIDILNFDANRTLRRLNGYAEELKNTEFNKQVKDIIEVGLRRFNEKYAGKFNEDSPFVLYEKYSRRDVSLLMNCGKDLSSTMYGMKRIGDDVFVFVTYHKEISTDEKNYVDGKPDYADSFEDNMIFCWDSQIGKGPDSSYMADVITARRKHLFIKKSDAESNFYYVGQFDVTDVKSARKKDNNGKEKTLAKVKMKMHQAVREDLLKYLQSSTITIEEKAI